VSSLNPVLAGQRLRDFARKKGITTAKALHELMLSMGMEMSLGGITKAWYGKHLPTSASASEIAKALGMSLDFYITGKEPPPPSVSQLKEIVAKMIEDAEGTISAKDATLTEIDLLLGRIDPAKREAILSFIRQMVPPEDKTM
jgi:transcriptional regulator with XRE-family HTH domain